jgi:hypothetical protein
MYLDSIFWFISWPILIYAAYRLSAYLLEKFEEQEVEAE